ncbi:MAG: hypothetical protein M1423_04535, partial [Acidobacteria bacterium]|nr:hypothetical protein [Acidobacteriota bacterium]
AGLERINFARSCSHDEADSPFPYMEIHTPRDRIQVNPAVFVIGRVEAMITLRSGYFCFSLILEPVSGEFVQKGRAGQIAHDPGSHFFLSNWRAELWSPRAGPKGKRTLPVRVERTCTLNKLPQIAEYARNLID